MSNYAQIEKLIKAERKLRFNVLSNRLEFQDTKGIFVPMEDYHVNSLLRKLKQSKLSMTRQDLLCLLVSDFTPRYDPIKEYFEELSPWTEQEEDYIVSLVNTVKVSEGEYFNWRHWFTKWLVGVVACALDEDAVNQTVLVFTGRQGLGKTTWLEKLIPKLLKQYYYGGILNLNNKDSVLLLAENVIMNLDELENLRRAEIGAFKELITKKYIKVRRPYGSVFENLPRRASLMGSVNQVDFLKDPTGNRRFLCFEPSYIDYEHNVNIDRIFAQAYHLYKNGFRYYFTQEQIKRVNLHNEQFTHVSIEQEVLESIIVPCERNEEDLQLNTYSLLDYLHEHYPITKRLTTRSLGIALHAMKIQRTKRNGKRLWFIKFAEAENESVS